MRVFFVLFIVIPLVEMWLLIQVGSQIGALLTVFLVFLTAAIGLALLRQQGLETLLRVNQRMAQGQLPATEILEGVMLAVGGALLLTPGFITDGVGFLCLIPVTRKWVIAAVLRRGVFPTMSHSHYQHRTFHRRQQPARRSSAGEGTTVDGEFHRES